MENISTNGTFNPYATFHVYRNNHVDTLITLFGLGSIVSSILIIFIMRRYDILHTRPNAYINNLCLSNILYLFFSPFFLNLFNIAETVQAGKICILDESLMLLFFALFIFATVLLLDWFINTYEAYKVSVNCKSSYTLVIVTIWIIFLTFFLTFCFQCAAGISVYPIITIVAEYFFIYFFCFITVIHIAKIFKFVNPTREDIESSLALEIVTLFYLCWLPNCLLYMLYAFDYEYWFNLEIFTYCIAHTYPIILFTLLYYRDRYFGVCCRNFFKNESLVVDGEQTACRGGRTQQFSLLT